MQPRVLPSRGELVFLSQGRRTFESYSQKVKLLRVILRDVKNGRERARDGE